MAKATKQAVATTENNNTLPAFMQGGKKNKIGNVDASDLIIPRMKLIQKISPEVDTFDAAKPGEFWHTIAEQSLGAEVIAVPILMRKTMVLWAPRNDDRGILARSNDCIHWDVPGLTFDVKPKNAGGKTVTYNLGENVASSTAQLGDIVVHGLDQFGSSTPGDSNSAPAIALTYNFLFYLPDFPGLSPVAVLNTRSAVKPGKELLTKIGLREGEHFGQMYKIIATDEEGAEGPYHGYRYEAAGYVQDKDVYDQLEAMFQNLNTSNNWRINEEEADIPDGGKAKGDTTGRGGKF